MTGQPLSSVLKLLGLDRVEVFQGSAFETSEELGNRIAPLLPKENLWIIKEQKGKKSKKLKPWNKVAMLCEHQRIIIPLQRSIQGA